MSEEPEIEPEVRIERFLGKISSEKRLIVILENAALETVKVFLFLKDWKHFSTTFVRQTCQNS